MLDDVRHGFPLLRHVIGPVLAHADAVAESFCRNGDAAAVPFPFKVGRTESEFFPDVSSLQLLPFMTAVAT